MSSFERLRYEDFLNEAINGGGRSVDAINERDDGGGGGREEVDGGKSSGELDREERRLWLTHSFVTERCCIAHDLHLRLQLWL